VSCTRETQARGNWVVQDTFRMDELIQCCLV
jgi:hypothetical protein